MQNEQTYANYALLVTNLPDLGRSKGSIMNKAFQPRVYHYFQNAARLAVMWRIRLPTYLLTTTDSLLRMGTRKKNKNGE